MSNDNENTEEPIVTSRIVESEIADRDLAYARDNMLSIGQLTLHFFKPKPDGFIPDGDLGTETFMEVTVPEGLPVEHFPSNGDLAQGIFSAMIEVSMLSVGTLLEQGLEDSVITEQQAQAIEQSFQQGLTEQVLHAHDSILNNMLWLSKSLNGEPSTTAPTVANEEVSADEQLDGFDELAGGEPTA